jgi:predicted acylesterase/phospholipase RssA/CRP-like cAMP-binding protein
MDILSFLESTEILGQLDKTFLQELIKDLEYINIKGGQLLIKQGEIGDSLYIVANGRLKVVVVTPEGENKLVGEVGKGECVGEMALLAQEQRSANVYTVRDSQLLKLSQQGFNNLVKKHPEALIQISRILVKRLRQSIHSSTRKNTVKTITIVTANPKTPLREFSLSLVKSLKKFGSTLHLNSNLLAHYQNREEELINWLNEQENQYDFLVYEADAEMSTWTQYCLRQGDRILIIAQGCTKPHFQQLNDLGLLDKNNKSLVSKELVLLHFPYAQIKNLNTQQWLNYLSINTHHHLRLNNPQDIERLTRRIIGKGIALVLGGGGARGLAHIGVLKALEEAKIPIDWIGGTSMGGIVGAMSAFGSDADTIANQLKESFRNFGEIFDLTFPIISLTTGRKIVTSLRKFFGDTQIEDLWINYFCVSSNLTRAKIMVHDRGILWRCLRASCALPGIIPPIMYNGDLLLDGGLLRNLPIDIMANYCEGSRIFAIDVSPKVELQIDYELGDSVSGWDVLWKQVNPYSQTNNIPNILTILTQTTVLSSRHARANLNMENKHNLYINPPLDDVKILDFSSLNKIIEIGYSTTIEKLVNYQINN